MERQAVIERDHLLCYPIKGTSMNLAGILPGDVIHLDPMRKPRDGDIVAAYVRDKGGTVKRWREVYHGTELVEAWLDAESDNPAYKATPVDHDVEVKGVVVAIERAGGISYSIPRRTDATAWPQTMMAVDVPCHQVRIADDAMSQAGLTFGMILQFEAGRQPQNHDLVVIEVDGELLVRRFQQKRTAGGPGRAWVVAEGAAWGPMRAEGRRRNRDGAYTIEPGVKVLGVVTATRAIGEVHRHICKPELPGKPAPPMRYRVDAPPEHAPVMGGDRKAPPPLAELLWEARTKLKGISPHEFARAIGIHIEEMAMIDGGHVPERKTLERMALRLAQLLDEPVTVEQLVAISMPGPFFAGRSE